MKKKFHGIWTGCIVYCFYCGEYLSVATRKCCSIPSSYKIGPPKSVCTLLVVSVNLFRDDYLLCGITGFNF